MQIPYENPDDYISEFEHKPCQFHKIAPGAPWAGCTCSGKYIRRKATPEEREQNIRVREARQEQIARAYRAVGTFPQVKESA